MTAWIDRARLIGTGASLIGLYLEATSRMVNVRVAIEERGRLSVASSEDFERVIRQRISLPTLFPFWNAHSLLLLCGYLALLPLRQQARNIEAVADDSPGGVLTQALYKRLGLVGRELGLVSPEKRLSDLKALFLHMPNLAMASDSHGPYRAISAGMARIVRQYRGNVTPLAAVASRTLHIFRGVRMSVPLPLTMILIGIGAPLNNATKRPIAAVSRELESALSQLEVGLKALLPKYHQ